MTVAVTHSVTTTTLTLLVSTSTWPGREVVLGAARLVVEGLTRVEKVVGAAIEVLDELVDEGTTTSLVVVGTTTSLVVVGTMTSLVVVGMITSLVVVGTTTSLVVVGTMTSMVVVGTGASLVGAGTAVVLTSPEPPPVPSSYSQVTVRRPTERSAIWVKTLGETSMPPDTHSPPGHLSQTWARAVLPFAVILIHLPQTVASLGLAHSP